MVSGSRGDGSIHTTRRCANDSIRRSIIDVPSYEGRVRRLLFKSAQALMDVVGG